jgi:hypothetical protein
MRWSKAFRSIDFGLRIVECGTGQARVVYFPWAADRISQIRPATKPRAGMPVEIQWVVGISPRSQIRRPETRSDPTKHAQKRHDIKASRIVGMGSGSGMGFSRTLP